MTVQRCTFALAIQTLVAGNMTVAPWKRTGMIKITVNVLSTVDVSLLPFTCRLLDEDHREMICTLQIDAELLDRSKWNFLIPHYKYTVFSPKAEKEEDCYEYLHDYTEIANRCLTIPNDKYCLLATQGGLIFFISIFAY